MTQDNKPAAKEIDRGDSSGAYLGELIPAVVGIAALFLLFSNPPKSRTANHGSDEPTPSQVEVREKLLSGLKDPALTEQIIEQLKKPETRELLADPEVMENIRKMVIAIEGDEVTLHSKMQALEARKALLEEVAPKKNWGARAIKDASEKKTAERN